VIRTVTSDRFRLVGRENHRGSRESDANRKSDSTQLVYSKQASTATHGRIAVESTVVVYRLFTAELHPISTTCMTFLLKGREFQKTLAPIKHRACLRGTRRRAAGRSSGQDDSCSVNSIRPLTSANSWMARHSEVAHRDRGSGVYPMIELSSARSAGIRCGDSNGRHTIQSQGRH
jgi:hypothetical protein